MPAASCENCGAALPKGSRFCPECGARVGAGETAVEELPPDETGQVYETARPRYFGVFRPGKALAPVFRALRETTGYAVESVAVHSTARVELYRLRRELTELLSRRAESARLLGEAVYADDEEGTKAAREQLAELDGLVSVKEDEMERTVADAAERIQRAQLQVQPTQIEPPPPAPSPPPGPE
jgi:zinc-ribbon domain